MLPFFCVNTQKRGHVKVHVPFIISYFTLQANVMSARKVGVGLHSRFCDVPVGADRLQSHKVVCNFLGSCCDILVK